MIDTILFDLDGTLLPMDQVEFVSAYFKKIANKFLDLNPEKVVQATQYGVHEMLKNDGLGTNEEVFWKNFEKICPVTDDFHKRFEDFYKKEFLGLKKLTSQEPLVKDIIEILKAKGYRLVLCTNPLFPQIATHTRVEWAGLNVEDFELITTYENSKFCKPNLKYYEEVFENINLRPEQCIMVGNDVAEDLCIKALGVKTFLLEDHVINPNNLEINTDYQGNFKDLYEFVKQLPERN